MHVLKMHEELLKRRNLPLVLVWFLTLIGCIFKGVASVQVSVERWIIAKLLVLDMLDIVSDELDVSQQSSVNKDVGNCFVSNPCVKD